FRSTLIIVLNLFIHTIFIFCNIRFSFTNKHIIVKKKKYIYIYIYIYSQILTAKTCNFLFLYMISML
ncbi:MAG: hypothetical protein MCS20_01610, partial [Candidatus Phytoplasma mali]|nr:hypothetical protein [Candidatus Phytoplasma australiense]MCG7202090.1 hypothetical protein [Candidatus Phytoplasma mali]